uniref:Uncharacterized protein n=1 Tax=Steinernema glaseri TaxID=37863 RepID=A0A1I8AC96_9BILA
MAVAVALPGERNNKLIRLTKKRERLPLAPSLSFDVLLFGAVGPSAWRRSRERRSGSRVAMASDQRGMKSSFAPEPEFFNTIFDQLTVPLNWTLINIGSTLEDPEEFSLAFLASISTPTPVDSGVFINFYTFYDYVNDRLSDMAITPFTEGFSIAQRKNHSSSASRRSQATSAVHGVQYSTSVAHIMWQKRTLMHFCWAFC